MINRDLTHDELDELVGLACANVNSSAHPCDLRIADLCGALVTEARRRRAADVDAKRLLEHFRDGGVAYDDDGKTQAEIRRLMDLLWP